VLPEDRLRSVAVVDVPVEDRDTAESELGLRVASGDGDVVEQAETHRLVGRRVMAGRAREREAAALRGGDRSAGSEQGGLEARLGGEGVPVEPGRLPDRPDSLDVVIGVAAEDRLLRRRLDLVA